MVMRSGFGRSILDNAMPLARAKVADRSRSYDREERLNRIHEDFIDGMDDQGLAQLLLFLDTKQRHQAKAKNDLDIDRKGKERLIDDCSDFCMLRPQFNNFSRMLWVLDSFSGVSPDDTMYYLFKMSYVDLKSKAPPEIFAEVESFDVTTFECPGHLETIAELAGFGYASMIANSAGQNLFLRLYYLDGATRNRWLDTLRIGEISSLIDDRTCISTAANLTHSLIDVPRSFNSIPEQFSVAYTMYDLGYDGSRVLDEYFVDFIIEKEKHARGSARSYLHDKVKEYFGMTLSEDDYAKIIESIRFDMQKAGESGLYALGISDVSDIILNAEKFKKPKLRQIECSERELAAAREILGSTDAEIGKQLFGEKYSGQDINKEIRDRVKDKKRGQAQRQAGIWGKLLPSSMCSELLKQLRGLNRRIEDDDFPYMAKKVNVEYFIGEIVHILDPVFSSPRTAFVKIGNDAESHWDKYASSVLDNKEICKDWFWFMQNASSDHNGEVPESHAPLVAINYKQFVLPRTVREASERGQELKGLPKYTSYGLQPLTAYISAAPLISDTYDELHTKFEELMKWTPNESLRLVIGAMYAFTNGLNDTAHRSRSAIRYATNTEVLLNAAKALPEPYHRLARALVREDDIGTVIDSKILAKYNPDQDHPDELDISKLNAITDAASTLKVQSEAARTHVREKGIACVAQAIRSYFDEDQDSSGDGEGTPSLDEADLILSAQTFAEEYLAPRYYADFVKNSEKAEYSTADSRIKLVADYFVRVSVIPPEKRPSGDKDPEGKTAKMLEFIAEQTQLVSVFSPEDHQVYNEIKQSANALEKRLQALQKCPSPVPEVAGVSGPANTSVNTFLTSAVEAFEQASVTHKYLSDLLQENTNIERMDERLDGPLASPSGTSIPTIRSAVQNMAHDINAYKSKIMDAIFTLDYADIFQFFKARFTNIDSQARGSKEDQKAKAVVDIDREMPLLEAVDAHLKTVEDMYCVAISEKGYLTVLPHQLQQHLQRRNTVATWMKYLSALRKNLETETGLYPLVPEIKSYHAESKLQISAEQTANFFTELLRGMRADIGTQIMERVDDVTLRYNCGVIIQELDTNNARSFATQIMNYVDEEEDIRRLSREVFKVDPAVTAEGLPEIIRSCTSNITNMDEQQAREACTKILETLRDNQMRTVCSDLSSITGYSFEQLFGDLISERQKLRSRIIQHYPYPYNPNSNGSAEAADLLKQAIDVEKRLNPGVEPTYYRLAYADALLAAGRVDDASKQASRISNLGNLRDASKEQQLVCLDVSSIYLKHRQINQAEKIFGALHTVLPTTRERSITFAEVYLKAASHFTSKEDIDYKTELIQKAVEHYRKIAQGSSADHVYEAILPAALTTMCTKEFSEVEDDVENLRANLPITKPMIELMYLVSDAVELQKAA